jgi:hypothetical protein
LLHQPSNDSESDEAEAIFVQRKARHAPKEVRNDQTEVWLPFDVSYNHFVNWHRSPTKRARSVIINLYH